MNKLCPILVQFFLFFTACAALHAQNEGNSPPSEVSESPLDLGAIVTQAAELNAAGQKSAAVVLLETAIQKVSRQRSTAALQAGSALAMQASLLDPKSRVAIQYLTESAAEAVALDAPVTNNEDGSMTKEFTLWASRKDGVQTAEWLQRIAIMSLNLRWLGRLDFQNKDSLLSEGLNSKQFLIVAAAISALSHSNTTFSPRMLAAAKRVGVHPAARIMLEDALLENQNPTHRSLIRSFFPTQDAYNAALQRQQSLGK